tara:strand:+ start:423 stop:833 length:411 start_codon:yes stop_codon:yes gene_type:complete
MRGGNLIFTTPDEIVPDSQMVEDNSNLSRYDRKIKFWAILLILFVAVSAFTNMLATGNQVTAEERFICVSLGFDYYEPGDWDCKEIREKYDAYNTQMLISNFAFLPIGFSLIAIGINLKRKIAHKRTQNSGILLQE